jgi:hypothetical protein
MGRCARYARLPVHHASIIHFVLFAKLATIRLTIPVYAALIALTVWGIQLTAYVLAALLILHLFVLLVLQETS